MGGLRVVGVLCVGIMVAVVVGLRAEEPTIPLYLYNGNVGVGTEMPQRLFHVGGDFQVGLIPTMSVVVTSAGRLGVGTTNPAALLQIASDGDNALVFDAHSEGFRGRHARFPGRVVVGSPSTGYPSVAYNAVPTSLGGFNRIVTDTAWRMSLGADHKMSFSYAPLGNAGTPVTWTDGIVLTSSGNVGIGTTSPGSTVHVSGASGTSYVASTSQESAGITAKIANTLNNSAVFSQLTFQVGNTGEHASIGMSGYSSNPFMYFKNNGAERMRIDSSGNVGIGTTSPAASLHIAKAVDGDFTALKLMNLQGSGSIRTGVGIDFHQFNSSEPVARILAQQDGTSGYQGNLQFYTRGVASNTAPVERLRITSAGNVGVGTTSPGGILSVYRDQNAATVLRVDNPNVGASAYSGIMLGNGASGVNFLMTGTGYTSSHAINNPGGGATIYTGSAAINGLVLGTSSGPLKFFAGSTTAERVRITSSGNVGIGTTTPVTALQVIGTVNATAFVGDGSGLTNISGGWSSGVGVFYTDRKVGVGTTTPLAKFHVVGNTGEVAMALTESGTTSRWYQQAHSSYLIADNDWLFYTKGAEKMRISSSGNVGIGTTLPLTKLHVAGTDGLTIAAGGSTARLSGTTNTLKFTFTTPDGLTISPDKAQLVLVSNYTSSTAAFRIGASHTSGYPSYSFIDDPNTGITGGTAADTLGFVTGGTEHMRVTASGNVGIRTNAPWTSLHVKDLITAGDAQDSTRGSLALSVGYVLGHTLVNFGSMYSSSYALIGYGVRSSQTVANTFLSTASNSGFSRGALQVGNELIFSNAGAQTTAVGSAVAMTERMRITSAGNVGIGTATPEEILTVRKSVPATVTQNYFVGLNLRNLSDGGNRILFGNSITTTLAAIDGTVSSSGSGTDDGILVFNTSVNGLMTEKMRITNGGNLGIGTPSPTQPLHVSGNALISSRMAINAAIDNAYALNVGGAIRATEMVVNVNGWADYVFDPEYVLRPLSEVERFVKEKRHLPGVPSEAELAAAGLNMAKMQTLQMQKIEELTLYVIALEKQNKALEARLEALEKGLAR